MVSYFKYQQVTDDEAINDDGTLRDGHCVPGVRAAVGRPTLRDGAYTQPPR
jgi:hypothetical protein